MNPQDQGGQSPYTMPQPQYQPAPQYPTAPPPQQPLSPQVAKKQKGSNRSLIVAVSILSILFVVAGFLAIWAYSNYRTATNGVQDKIDLAVAAAKKDQANSDETNFTEREKQPNRQFVGPDNYGRVTFNYPKTWSVYVSSDVQNNGGTYQAYLNPGVVPPVGASNQLFALRVTIQQMGYSQVLQQYQSLVQAGKLTSSNISVNGHNGTRLDGNFTSQLRGSAVFFQIRDKVLIVQTDANTFDSDYENIIKTINFNN